MLDERILRRTIVIAVIRNRRDEYLICKMPDDRGVFPGQWGLPGGGMEEGETVEDALRREVREEVGLKVTDLEPLSFRDALEEKTYKDGTKRAVYMIYLLFACRSEGGPVQLNEEFSEYAWVEAEDLPRYDLNRATRETFQILFRGREPALF